MKSSRKIAMFLALALVLALFATACSGTPADTAESTDPASTEEAAPADAEADAPAEDDPYAETLDVLMGGAGNAGGWIMPDSKVEKYLEEKYNLNITPWQVDMTNAEQTGLKLSAGEVPDFGYQPDVDLMYRQGLSRSIPESMILEFAPAYAEILDANPYGWKINKWADATEPAYEGLAGFAPDLATMYWINAYRLDWLENVGIAPKGEVKELTPGVFWTEEAFNLDEFTNIVDQFRNGDPDKNGVQDTWGISAGPYVNMNWYGLSGAFGLNTAWFNQEENGQAVPYYTSTAYKNLLKYISDLYNKGLIDPESATQGFTDAWAQMTLGANGWQSLDRSYVDLRFNDRPPMSVIAANPDAKVLLTPATIGMDGTQASPMYSDSPFMFAYTFGKDASDAVVERILRFYNDYLTDPEVFVTVNYGFEGESFDWAGEPWESACVMRDLSVEEKGAIGAGAFHLSLEPEQYNKFKLTDALFALTEYAFSDAGKSISAYQTYTADLYGEFAVETQEYNDLYYESSNLIINEFYFDATMGADVDANWDAYIADLEGAGLAAYTELINKYPVVADEMK